ncbi:MAG TPA: autotransporter domain-containing protein, partial [Sphingomicrobium sp.]
MRKFSAILAALSASAAFTSPASAADTYSQTVFFGDSLTDAGFFRPLLPAAIQPVTGQFTTNPGDVWAELLADYYNTNAEPNGNGQTGSDYAAGGARVGLDTVGALGPIPSLTSQMNSYLASTGGTADPDALYTVWGGANDLFAITNAGADPTTTISSAVASEVGIIQTLDAAGARYILVPTVPDLGVTPAFRVQGAAAQAAGTSLTQTYNQALFSSLEAAGLRVIPLDTFSLIREIVADPGAYGFLNATGTACQPQITANSLLCNPTTYVTPTAPNDYVFADGVHPTTAAHRILFQYAVSILEAPRLIQHLPHNAVVTGRSRAERVAQHHPGAAGDGLRWWADGRFDIQSNNRLDNKGPALLTGVDLVRGNLVAGLFGGVGKTHSKLIGRTDFDEHDLTGGLFVGWYGSTVWANAQASYSSLDYDVDREVVLGAATRVHSGSPGGHNLTVGGQAGANFALGALKTGPVAGLLIQRVKVDGYAESDGTLSTALRFADQTYRSTLGSIGWRAAVELEPGTMPYAQVTYDHEFGRVGKETFAELQTIESLPYAVPGNDWDRSYATATAGIRTVFAGVDANIGGSVTL